VHGIVRRATASRTGWLRTCAVIAALVCFLALGARSPGPASATGALTSANPLLWDISCSSTELCVAIDDKGHAVTSTDPTDALPTWSASETGLITPSAISCAATALCVAVNSNGAASITTDPMAPAPSWATMPVGPPHVWIEDISCPTASLCVAVDREGDALTTTDPAAAAPTWNAAPVDSRPVPLSEHLSAVSCASSSLCVAVDTLGDAVVSTDPAATTPRWSEPVQIDSVALSDISCPTTTLCVAVDPSGRAVTATDLKAALPSWSTPEPISNSNLRGVSCPAMSFCVSSGELLTAAGGYGLGVSISTAPGAGTTAWHATPLLGDPGYPESPTSISCASVSLCVIAVGAKAIISTDPTAATPTWSPPRTIDAVPAGELSVLGAPVVSGASLTFVLNCAGQDLARAFQFGGGGVIQECSGSASLTTTEQLSANGRVVTGVGPAARERRSRTVAIGQTTLVPLYAGDAISSEMAKVTLNGTGERLLAKFKRLPATLSVSAPASELRVPAKTVIVSTLQVMFKVKAPPRRKSCHRAPRHRHCSRGRHRSNAH
jgi:hypothetical protein